MAREAVHLQPRMIDLEPGQPAPLDDLANELLYPDADERYIVSSVDHPALPEIQPAAPFVPRRSGAQPRRHRRIDAANASGAFRNLHRA